MTSAARDARDRGPREPGPSQQLVEHWIDLRATLGHRKTEAVCWSNWRRLAGVSRLL
jgi:hypothetical protein